MISMSKSDHPRSALSTKVTRKYGRTNRNNIDEAPYSEYIINTVSKPHAGGQGLRHILTWA
jgi:hypothetical protein